VALATQHGMRTLVGHCHLGLGTLYRRMDKREQAQEHLATATTMYREMGMTYWLERAEAGLKYYTQTSPRNHPGGCSQRQPKGPKPTT
jgi:hypothetical protein